MTSHSPGWRSRPGALTWALAHQNATTGILLGLMAVLAAISGGVAAWLTRDGEMLTATASAVLFTTPVVIPIALAALLGGLAVHPRGWVPALGLSAGLWLGPVGELTDHSVLLWAGVYSCVAGVAGFWVTGWVARVPMWIGLGSWKWVEVRRAADAPAPPAPNVDAPAPGATPLA